jgi:hypothetical protein
MTLGHILTKQMPKLWLTAKSLTIFAGSFVVGFAMGLLVRRYLVFKNEVVVGDIVNLFSAVVIVLVLQNAIQKRVRNLRVEKDLLIARITAMDGALNETHKLFMRRAADVDSVEDATMFGIFKDLSNHLYLLEKSKVRITSKELKTLKAARHEYRKRVLGDDFSPGPYALNTINLEERTYRRISLELISVIFEINHQ